MNQAAENPAPASAAAGEHRGDPGPHRTLADPKRSLSPDDRVVAHFQAGDIGDRVQRTGLALEGHSEIPGSGCLLRKCGRGNIGNTNNTSKQKGG